MRKTALLLAAVTAIAVLVVIVSNGESQQKTQKTFEQLVNECNGAATTDKFNCYKNTIKIFASGDSSNYINQIDSKKAELFREDPHSYGVFGTNCHTFYHALGDYLYTSGNEMNSCPDTCAGGCVMGYLKRAAYELEYKKETLMDIYESCPNLQMGYCSHEMGHVFHDKYTKPVLEVVDNLSKTKNNSRLPAQNDLQNEDEAYEDCRRYIPVTNDDLYQCYDGVGHNMFLFQEYSPKGYSESARSCIGLLPEDRDKCNEFLAYRVGLNEAASKFAGEKFEEGNKNCSDVVSAIGKQDLISKCYYGIGRGLGIYLQSQYPDLKAATEIPEPQIVDKLQYYPSLCTNAPLNLNKDCYKGLFSTIYRDYYKHFDLRIEDIENSTLP